MTKVSIITVCYNSAVHVRDAVESVLSQDYANIEYIIVDGKSQDGTLEIVNEYQDRIATVISEPDEGIYDAMNKGILAATGDVVGILNSDDFYQDETAVSLLIAQMKTARAECVFADLLVVDPEDTNRVLRYYNSGRFRPSLLRYGWMPAHPTLMVKRTLYERCGGYKLDYQIAADYEMVVRLQYAEGASYAYLPRVSIKMRSGGVSSNGLRARWILNKEIVRACRSNGVQTSLPRVLLKFPVKMLELVRRPG